MVLDFKVAACPVAMTQQAVFPYVSSDPSSAAIPGMYEPRWLRW